MLPRFKNINKLSFTRHNGINKKLVFSPQTDGNNFLSLSFYEGMPGENAKIKTELGDQIIVVLNGCIKVVNNGTEYHIRKDMAFLVPSGSDYDLIVEEGDPLKAFVVGCEECILANDLKKEFEEALKK